MQLFHPIRQRAGCLGLGELAALIGGVRDDLVTWDIKDLVEPGARIERDGEWKNPFSKMFANLGERLFEIGLFLIEGVDDNHFWNAIFVAYSNRIRPNTNSMICVHDD